MSVEFLDRGECLYGGFFLGFFQGVVLCFYLFLCIVYHGFLRVDIIRYL